MGSPHAALVHETTPAFQDAGELNPLRGSSHVDAWFAQPYWSGTAGVVSAPFQRGRNLLRLDLSRYVCHSVVWFAHAQARPSLVAAACRSVRISDDVALRHPLDLSYHRCEKQFRLHLQDYGRNRWSEYPWA